MKIGIKRKKNEYFGTRWNSGIKMIPSAQGHHGWCKTMVSPPPLFSVSAHFSYLVDQRDEEKKLHHWAKQAKQAKQFLLKKIIITFLTKVKSWQRASLKKSLARGTTSCYGFVFNINPVTKNGKKKPVIIIDSNI